MKKIILLSVTLAVSGCSEMFDKPANFGIRGFDELTAAMSEVRDQQQDAQNCQQFAESVQGIIPGGTMLTVWARAEMGGTVSPFQEISHALYCIDKWCADGNSYIPIDIEQVGLLYSLSK